MFTTLSKPKPEFSVVMPCWNAQATIGATIESIQAQSLRNWELICVDDGSSDETPSIIAAYAKADARIQLVTHASSGPAAARNCGVLRASSADIIAFCDADDLWAEGKLAALSRTFRDDRIDGAFGKIGFFKDTPADARVFSSVPAGPLSIDMLLGENPVCTMSNITLRKSAFIESGGFDEYMVHNEDLDWLIRLVGTGHRIIGLPELHTWYRTSIGGLSTDLGAMAAGRLQALLTARHFGVSPSRSSHAVHHRYLARRALRLAATRTDALRHVICGVAQSPSGFFSPLRRGALTCVGAALAVVLPSRLTRRLFA